MATAIKVENLSKAYQLGQFGTNTISGDVQRWWMTKILGKEDPFLKIGESNNRSVKGKTNITWSLKDINFEVQQGEALGIIGQNGAGKSTLLKILSRVTSPTIGGFKIKGRVASLLEVGTGFHPELTGKENIFLNGAMLGMRKHEIKNRLDEIVDFAGIERYLETPVKRYSSGMYVRLAFAVAAHLDAEILVVDEVLAVGDAEFQKKCLGKMGDISKGQGRTILFVSHNMQSIIRLCTSCIVLKNGEFVKKGEPSNIVKDYKIVTTRNKINFDKKSIGRKITRIELKEDYVDSEGLKIEIEISSNPEINNPNIGLVVKNQFMIPIFGTNMLMHGVEKSKNYFSSGVAILEIKDLQLLPGIYFCDFYLGDGYYDYDFLENALEFEIFQSRVVKTERVPSHETIGSLAVNAKWKLI